MKTIEELEKELKIIEDQKRALVKKGVRIESEIEDLVTKEIIGDNKYWKKGRQDFYFIGETECIHVEDYMGGGGFTVSMGMCGDLTDNDDFINGEIVPCSKEEFEKAFAEQCKRVLERK